MIKKLFLLCLITQIIYGADQDQAKTREIKRNPLDIALEEADILVSQGRISPNTAKQALTELAAAARQEIDRSEAYIEELIKGDDEALKKFKDQLDQASRAIDNQNRIIDEFKAVIPLMQKQQDKVSTSREEAVSIAEKYATFTQKQAQEIQALQAQINRLETQLAWTRAAAQQKT